MARGVQGRLAGEVLALVKANQQHQSIKNTLTDWFCFNQLSVEYYLQMARLPSNTELKKILRRLLVGNMVTFAQHYSLRSTICLFYQQNHILQALESGDTEHAFALMDTHLHAVEAKLKHNANSSKIDFITLFSQLA